MSDERPNVTVGKRVIILNVWATIMFIFSILTLLLLIRPSAYMTLFDGIVEIIRAMGQAGLMDPPAVEEISLQ
tara:strand:+ start:4631 stop:4849 length:219 start_codon:yes stop_codon:yes gene_type:complete